MNAIGLEPGNIPSCCVHEYFIHALSNIDMELNCGNGFPGSTSQLKSTGTLFITPCRLIFVPKRPTTLFYSFCIPLLLISQIHSPFPMSMSERYGNYNNPNSIDTCYQFTSPSSPSPSQFQQSSNNNPLPPSYSSLNTTNSTLNTTNSTNMCGYDINSPHFTFIHTNTNTNTNTNANTSSTTTNTNNILIPSLTLQCKAFPPNLSQTSPFILHSYDNVFTQHQQPSPSEVLPKENTHGLNLTITQYPSTVNFFFHPKISRCICHSCDTRYLSSEQYNIHNSNNNSSNNSNNNNIPNENQINENENNNIISCYFPDFITSLYRIFDLSQYFQRCVDLYLTHHHHHQQQHQQHHQQQLAKFPPRLQYGLSQNFQTFLRIVLQAYIFSPEKYHVLALKSRLKYNNSYASTPQPSQLSSLLSNIWESLFGGASSSSSNQDQISRSSRNLPQSQSQSQPPQYLQTNILQQSNHRAILSDLDSNNQNDEEYYFNTASTMRRHYPRNTTSLRRRGYQMLLHNNNNDVSTRLLDDTDQYNSDVDEYDSRIELLSLQHHQNDDLIDHSRINNNNNNNNSYDNNNNTELLQLPPPAYDEKVINTNMTSTTGTTPITPAIKTFDESIYKFIHLDTPLYFALYLATLPTQPVHIAGFVAYHLKVTPLEFYSERGVAFPEHF